MHTPSHACTGYMLGKSMEDTRLQPADHETLHHLPELHAEPHHNKANVLSAPLEFVLISVWLCTSQICVQHPLCLFCV